MEIISNRPKLNQVIQSVARTGQKKKYRPRVSNAGSCPRALTYQALGVEGRGEVGRMPVLLSDGNLHEDSTITWLEQGGVNVIMRQYGLDVAVIEGESTDPWFCDLCNKEITGNILHGHIDGVVDDGERYYLFEHKGLGDFGFENLDREFPKGYITQCSAYIKGLQNAGFDITSALLLVKNKNNSEYRQIYIEYDSESDIARAENEWSGLVDIFSDVLKGLVDLHQTVATSRAPGANLPDRPFDQESFQCVTGDTMVKSNEGWEEIQHLQVGDLVLTSDGTFQKINAKRSNLSNKKIYQIKPYNLDTIKATADHEILVEKRTKKAGNNRSSVRNETRAEWRSVDTIIKNTDKYQMLYRIDSRVDPTFSLSIHELNLIGLFIAEGSITSRNGYDYGLTFSLHEKEKDLVEILRASAKNVLGCKIHQKIITDSRNRNRYMRVDIHNVESVSFIEKYVHGRRSHLKYLDEKIMTMPVSKQIHLLHIMNRGDGSFTKNRETSVDIYTTTSRKLALQVQQIYLRNSTIAGITRNKPSKNGFEGSRESYHVNYFKSDYNYGFIEDGFLKVPIHSIIEVEKEEVFDISVENNHNFLTSAGIVHNCTYCAYSATCWAGLRAEVSARSTGNVLSRTSDLGQAIRQLADAREEKRQVAEKEKEAKRKINLLMAENNIKSGETQDYKFWLSPFDKKYLDESAIPVDVLEIARKSMTFMSIKLKKL